jgi:hypothetical protein
MYTCISFCLIIYGIEVIFVHLVHIMELSIEFHVDGMEGYEVILVWLE